MREITDLLVTQWPACLSFISYLWCIFENARLWFESFDDVI